MVWTHLCIDDTHICEVIAVAHSPARVQRHVVHVPVVVAVDDCLVEPASFHQEIQAAVPPAPSLPSCPLGGSGEWGLLPQI